MHASHVFGEVPPFYVESKPVDNKVVAFWSVGVLVGISGRIARVNVFQPVPLDDVVVRLERFTSSFISLVLTLLPPFLS